MTEEKKPVNLQRSSVLSHVAEMALIEKESDPAIRALAIWELCYRVTKEGHGPRGAAIMLNAMMQISKATVDKFTGPAGQA